MAIEDRVPSLGESVTEATVGQWFKKPGDAVQADEAICELETDKVTVEVPAPAAGVLEAIQVQQGETVAVGAVLGTIREGAAAAAAPTAKEKAKPAETEVAAQAAKPAAAAAPAKAPAEASAPAAAMPPAPSARKLMEEKGL